MSDSEQTQLDLLRYNLMRQHQQGESHATTFAFQKYRLVLEREFQTSRAFIIDREKTRVGRAPDNDLVIQHDSVAPYHFEIRATPAGHRILALDTTHFDGCQIMDAMLHPNAHLQIGSVGLLFQPLDEWVEIPLSLSQSFGSMIGYCVAMRALFHQAKRMAEHDAALLISGEKGTGKQLLAKAIHATSERKKGPFIVVNCPCVANHLIESVLCGKLGRIGAFQKAHGGVLYLKEIAALGRAAQSKLLRILESDQAKPIGANDPFSVDVRVIASSQRNLNTEVKEQRFLKNLLFRINVFELNLLPLRERKEDIPLLANHFAEQMADSQFSQEALDMLTNYHWPGNVAELRSFVEKASRQVPGSTLLPRTLLSTAANQMRKTNKPKRRRSKPNGLPINQAREQFERDYLVDLLKRHDQNVSAAARTARIHRQSLHRLLKKHAIRSANSSD